MTDAPTPTPFLEVHVRDLTLSPTLRGFCAGYETGQWRMQALARHIIEWLPEFALDLSEREEFGTHNGVKLIGKAALSVYTSDKYKKRGEFGEILLHIALRQDCDSIPAISKIYFKSSSNDTVKGFDAVHIVGEAGQLELWLGEAKFYNDAASAIRDVIAELEKHAQRKYLREEFIWVGNKLDTSNPHYEELSQLLDRNTSLDAVFKRLCFPILLTYDSACIARHTECAAQYVADFQAELRKHHADFVGKGAPADLRVHLMLLPLQAKAALVDELNRRLKQCQDM